MIVLAGTVPYKTGLYIGPADVQGHVLNVGGISVPVERGTAAMAAACGQACRYYGLEMPLCLLAGDVGDSRGTDLMFEELNSRLDAYDPDVVALHYMFPKLSHGGPFIEKITSLKKKPVLIADAGGMYLMKTISAAPLCDVFTPDKGELYFLSDEFAPHPLYVRSELLGEDIPLESLAAAAYKNKNTARTTLIKGAVDTIYTDGVKVNELSQPQIPAMEAIGGTGDTITGLVAALRSRRDPEADYKSLAVNRLIGEAIVCTPATQIAAFIDAIPRVLERYEKKTR